MRQMFELFVLTLILLLLSASNNAAQPRETGERPMHKASYRTRDGSADYRFGFSQRPDGTWRIYILSQPDYGRRSANTFATHRLSDGSPYQYICFTGSLDSLDQAKQVAALWADRTQQYIRTGTF
jgi:hypothetical protein